MWGPLGSTPDSKTIDLLGTDWGGSQSAGGITEILGYDFGGRLTLESSGDIKTWLEFADFGAGSVDVDYPVAVALTYPAPDSFRPGAKVNIGSAWNVRPGARLVTETPSAGTIDLKGSFQIAAKGTGEFCAFGCADFPLLPEFTFGPIKGTVLPDVPALGHFPGFSSPIDTKERHEFSKWESDLLGAEGWVGLPNVKTTSSVDGQKLKASGTDEDFINLEIDLTSFTKAGELLSYGTPPNIFGAGVEGTLASLDTNINMSMGQDFTFDAAVCVSLDVSEPVDYQVIGVTESECGAISGTATNTVKFEAGKTVEVTVPPTATAPLTVTPHFSLLNAFKNQTTVTVKQALAVNIGHAELEIPEIEVVPAIPIPEVCLPIPFDGEECTGGEIPAVKSSGEPITLKPIKSIDLKYGDSNTPKVVPVFDSEWLGGVPGIDPGLSGFSTIDGAVFQLNPELAPKVDTLSITSTSTQEGSLLTFTAAVSDPDNDPTVTAWNFGDGTIAGNVSPVTHAYVDEGSYTAVLTATDSHRMSDTRSAQVTVTNAPPAFDYAGLQLTAPEGSLVTLANDAFGQNLIKNPTAEAGTSDWQTSSVGTAQYGGATTSAHDLQLFRQNLVKNGGAELPGAAGTTPDYWVTSGGLSRLQYGSPGYDPNKAPVLVGTNLVKGGGAEGDGDSGNWTVTEGQLAWGWYNSNGMPYVTNSAIQGSRLYYGGQVWRTAAYQEIDVSSLSLDWLAEGTFSGYLDAWLGGWADQPDDAKVTATIYGSGGNVLQEYWVGPVAPWERENQSKLVPRNLSNPWLDTAAKVRISLLMTRHYGTDNDGYVDAVSFQIRPTDGTSQPLAEALPVQTTPGLSGDVGTYFFYGGTNDVARGYQQFDVGSAQALIDEGMVKFELSGRLGGLRKQNDTVELSAVFLRDNLTSAGETKLQVTQVDRGGTTKFFAKAANGYIPVGTRFIQVHLMMDRGSGVRNDGYAENIVLQLDLPGADLTATPSSHYPTVASPGPASRGGSFFYGGTAKTATATQTVDIPDKADAYVDAGKVTYDLSGYFGGYAGQEDKASLTATFLGQDGSQIGTPVQIGNVAAAARSNGTGLIKQGRTGPVPVGTRQVKLDLRMDGVNLPENKVNDGYADNLSLVLNGPAGLTFKDPGVKDVITAAIDWGDGKTTTPAPLSFENGQGMVNGSHIYSDNREYTAKVTLNDGDGPSGAMDYTITVENVAPAAVGRDSVFLRNQESQVVVATYTDAGAGDTHTATIDWGDATLPQPGTASGNVVRGTHKYSTAGTYNVIVTVKDDDGADATATAKADVKALQVPNLGLVATGGGPTEGAPVTLQATFGTAVNPDTGQQQAGLTYKAVLDFGDGTTSAPLAGVPGQAVTFTHTYPESRAYAATLKVLAYSGTDLMAGNEISAEINVANAAPALEVGEARTVAEGGEVTLRATVVDPGSLDTQQVNITWGDGAQSNLSVMPGAEFAATHRYTNQGSFVVTAKATDDDSGVSPADSFTVTVTNAAPAIGEIANQTAKEGETVHLLAAFTDAGPADVHTASVAWGDGTTESLQVLQSTREVAGSHRYEQNGAYTAQVTVKDDSDAAHTRAFAVQVSNVTPLVSAGTDQSVAKAKDATVSAEFTDPGAQDTHTATINWGDGSAVAQPTVQKTGDHYLVGATHQYSKAGTYTVTVTAKDSDNATGTDSLVVSVLNEVPRIAALPDLYTTEGTPSTQKVRFDDSDPDLWTVTVGFGDGSAPQTLVVTNREFDLTHTYNDDSVHDVTVRICDGDNGCAEDQFTVTVRNTPPGVQIAGLPGTVTEGTTVTLSAQVSDAGPLDTEGGFTTLWEVTRNGTALPDSAGPTLTLPVSDNGAYAVTLTATDKDGASSSTMATFAAVNVNPVVTISAPPATVPEGVPLTLTATATDAGTDDNAVALPISWEVWLDDLRLETGSGSAFTFTPPDGGGFRVTASATDKEGATGQSSVTFVATSVPPAMALQTAAEVDEGQPVTAVVPFTDTSVGDSHRAKVKWGDTTISDMKITEPASGQSSGTATTEHIYADNGVYTVAAALCDRTHCVSENQSVTVRNLAPVVAVGTYSTIEGEPLSAKFSFTDAGSADTHTATIAWGDTTTSDGTVTETPVGPPGTAGGTKGSVAATHVYLDSGSYTGTVKVCDDDGACHEQPFTVTVTNAPPLVDVGNDQQMKVGENLVLQATYSDKGQLDTHTASVDWGDSVTADVAAAGGAVSANHTYAGPGSYTVTLTVCDDEGACASDSLTAVVAGADLSVTKTHAGDFRQGETGRTYTIVIANQPGAGSTDGSTVTLTDSLPAGLTATGLSGDGWTCALETLSCSRSDALAPGSSYPAVTLTVNVAPNAPASVTNTALVSGGGDTTPENNSAADVTSIAQAPPDLSVTKTHLGNFVRGQTGATYVITVVNGGLGPTSGTVTVTDTLPEGLTASSMGGSGWTCALDSLTCTRSDALPVGGIYPDITLVVDVAATAPNMVTNQVTVAGEGDTNPANNTASDVATVLDANLLVWLPPLSASTPAGMGATDTLPIQFMYTGSGSPNPDITVSVRLRNALTNTLIAGFTYQANITYDAVPGVYTCRFQPGDYGLASGTAVKVMVYFGGRLKGTAQIHIEEPQAPKTAP